MGTLWICQQWKGEGKPCEFQGVFDSEQGAIDACVTDDLWIHPATINKRIAQETLKPNGYYPRLETKDKAEARLGHKVEP